MTQDTTRFYPKLNILLSGDLQVRKDRKSVEQKESLDEI